MPIEAIEGFRSIRVVLSATPFVLHICANGSHCRIAESPHDAYIGSARLSALKRWSDQRVARLVNRGPAFSDDRRGNRPRRTTAVRLQPGGKVGALRSTTQAIVRPIPPAAHASPLAAIFAAADHSLVRAA